MNLTERQMLCAIARTISIFVFLGIPTITHALSCAQRLFTLSEAYETADSIVVGLITECKEEVSSDPWAHGGSECSFSSLEVLKESIPARDYHGAASSSGCGLSLHVGNKYLLFLDGENRPMRFSAALSSDQNPAQLSNHYLRIIREFRDGVVNHLAEPWMFGEFKGTCSLWHRVGGNQIRFNRRKGDAPQQPEPEWTQETTDGQTVYRSSVPSFSGDSTLPTGVVDIVAFGDIPDYADDALMLNVHIPERPPAPLRQATLSVGTRTWLLNRVEMSLSLPGAPAQTIINYSLAGNVAEQILSAMIQPSDILVSAALVASKTDSDPPPEVTEPGQGAFMPAPSNNEYFGPALPETGSTTPAITPSARAARSYETQSEPPQPFLRMKSRSTQLSGVIESFRACYEQDKQ
jgi:hypothetical protein